MAPVLTLLLTLTVLAAPSASSDCIPDGGSAMGMDSPVKLLAAVTVQAAWLIPYESHLHWMIPAAATTLLIPSFSSTRTEE